MCPCPEDLAGAGGAPAYVVPWERDFIAELAGYLTRQAGDDLGGFVVVFPHRRPARYLREALKKEAGQGRILPETWPVEQWLGRLRALGLSAPLRRAGPLDRARLLYDVTEELRAEGLGRLDGLPEEPRRFFPWGLRLDALLEELLRHGRRPDNLLHVEDQVLPAASALLESLADIHARYLERLGERGWTTPGLDLAEAAARPDLAEAQLAGRRLILAGFHALTGVEDALFHHLWRRRGAVLIWRSDARLAEGGQCRPPAREHQALLRRWAATAELLPGLAPAAPAAGPAVRFHEGFDLHSQLVPLAEELRALDDPAGAAVVAPDPAMLMPVLHGLPDKAVNVSMGFPLTRSAAHRLIEAVLRCQETAADGRYHWRDVTALIRHPYLRILPADPEDPEAPTLGQALRVLEGALRQGEKYCDPLALAEAPDLPAAAVPLLRRALNVCLPGFAAPRTLGQLAAALTALADLLDEAGDAVWTRHPLDAECLHRLRQTVIPGLADTAMSDEELDQGSLFACLRRLCQAERVPFEADPLGGLQVMGLLETRLLRFRRVYLLGATEDLLPGSPPPDPLLPDSLRRLLELPDARQSDAVFAYNVHCLLCGAEEAVIFYRTGGQSGETLDDKAVRSRFVEQLLFEQERRLGRLITPSPEPDSPLRPVLFPLRPIVRPRAGAPLSDAARDRLLDRLAGRPLSASFLNGYLTCPYSFYLDRLAFIRPLDEVEEDGDQAGFGELLHGLLRDLLAPWRGRELDAAALADRREWLLDEYARRLREDPGCRRTPFDQRLGLAKAGRLRLADFLDGLPAARLLDLEGDHAASLPVSWPGLPALPVLRLSGRLDRVDERDGRILVLDYKTGRGRAARPDPDLWTDRGFWDRLDGWSPGRQADAPLLPELADRLKSVQLPLYLHLCARTHGQADNAGLVLLGENGKELWLLDRDAEELAPILVDDLVPRLVRFLVRHMTESPRLEPRPSRACAWCAYASGCGQAPAD